MRSGELVIPVGPPGAGKTSWTSARFPVSQVVSLDAYRGMIADDQGDQAATPAALAVRDIILEQRLKRGLPTVVDSTNCRPGYRVPMLEVAGCYSRPTVAVLFHTTFAECLRRQGLRDRQVPADVIERMFAAVAVSWRDLSREVDCVVHVAPAGTSAYRVGDLPGTGGRPGWLDAIPVVPDVTFLPWEPPYAR